MPCGRLALCFCFGLHDRTRTSGGPWLGYDSICEDRMHSHVCVTHLQQNFVTSNDLHVGSCTMLDSTTASFYKVVKANLVRISI